MKYTLPEWSEETKQNIYSFLKALSEGYNLRESSDENFLVIQDPEVTDEKIALYGADPNIVISMRELDGLEEEDYD